MKDALRQKKVTRTYRNGRAVFQLECIIRLRTNIRGNEYHVTEQRASFKDEKAIFIGKQDDAERFYDETTSITIATDVPAKK